MFLCLLDVTRNIITRNIRIFQMSHFYFFMYRKKIQAIINKYLVHRFLV